MGGSYGKINNPKSARISAGDKQTQGFLILKARGKGKA
jgi:hypothetical protein